MKYLLTILILLLLATSLYAQELSEPLAPLNTAAPIEFVQLTYDDATSEATALMTYQDQTCLGYTSNAKQLDDSTVMIEVFSPMADPVIECAGNSQQMDVTFAAEIDRTYTLIVNDVYHKFFVPRASAENLIMDVAAQIIRRDTPNFLIPHWREDMIGFEPTLVQDGDAFTLNLSGGTNGCSGFLGDVVTQDDAFGNLYHIEVYRLHTIDTSCPENLVPTDYSITFDSSITTENVFSINGRLYGYDTETTALIEYTRQSVMIEDVTIEPTDSEFTVAVSAIQNGHCGSPLQTAVVNGANGSAIEFVAFIPAVTICTSNLIPYTETFTVDSVPIAINGQIYTLDS